MANERLNIPRELRVGYQKRENTYSGKLAYVTYLDKKNKIAKHTSWEHWRTKELGIGEFENKPTEGFVLNKRVGGYKSGWNYRETKCRVYDPRGFEIEITLENLLFILQECTSTKGKGLEGEFVYAWEGPELILLPVCSEDYRLSTELQDRKEKIMVRDLKLGAAYKSKEYPYLIYIGKMEWYLWEEKEDKNAYSPNRWSKPTYEQIRLVKMSTFVDVENKKFVGYKTTDKLDYLIEEHAITADDIATYVENYKTTAAYKGSDLKTLTLKGDLDEWIKYVETDDSNYSWGMSLLLQKPGDEHITCIKGTKQYKYQGYLLSEWLNKHSVNKWGFMDYEAKEKLTAEFEKGKQIEIHFTVVAYLTFKDGKFRREEVQHNRFEYPTINLTKDDWKYMCCGTSYDIYHVGGFLNSKGEFVKKLSNGSISHAESRFNENAPLPENNF